MEKQNLKRWKKGTKLKQQNTKRKQMWEQKENEVIWWI